MKIINLINSDKFVMVDDCDFEHLIKFRWHILKGKRTNYCKIMTGKRDNRKSVLMHRFLLNPSKGMEVDHVDGNGLNNQKSNLRICTAAQNRSNQIRNRPNKTSKFKGVSWNRESKKWVSNIQHNKNPMFLGFFSNEIEAAKSYDQAAKECFKEFAYLNFR